jgi:hypothetical protein
MKVGNKLYEIAKKEQTKQREEFDIQLTGFKQTLAPKIADIIIGEMEAVAEGGDFQYTFTVDRVDINEERNLFTNIIPKHCNWQKYSSYVLEEVVKLLREKGFGSSVLCNIIGVELLEANE